MKRVIFLLVTGLALGWWYTASQAPQSVMAVTGQNLSPPSPRAVIDSQEISEVVSQDIDLAHSQVNLQHLPRSLRGTPLPQPVTVDGQGQLVVDLQLRKLFDYYLSGIGEEPLAHIVARIKHQLSQQLQGAVLAQAVTILDGYLQYRNQLADILAEQVSPESAIEQVRLVRQQMIEARYQYLSAQSIEGFFARSDKYDEYMLARQQISQNDQLTSEQKQQAYIDLQTSAPDWLLAQRHFDQQLRAYQQQQQQLQAQGGDQGQLQQLRALSFGVDAADRLAELEQQRRQWQQLLSQYRQQLKPLLDSGITGEELQSQLQLLRQHYFEPEQLLRVDALDRQRFGW